VSRTAVSLWANITSLPYLITTGLPITPGAPALDRRTTATFPGIMCCDESRISGHADPESGEPNVVGANPPVIRR
jgi:hypothetical protein